MEAVLGSNPKEKRTGCLSLFALMITVIGLICDFCPMYKDACSIAGTQAES
jgi:hypothetical protein